VSGDLSHGHIGQARRSLQTGSNALVSNKVDAYVGALQPGTPQEVHSAPVLHQPGVSVPERRPETDLKAIIDGWQEVVGWR